MSGVAGISEVVVGSNPTHASTITKKSDGNRNAQGFIAGIIAQKAESELQRIIRPELKR